MSELRQIKYEMFIKNINENIQKRNVVQSVIAGMTLFADQVASAMKKDDGFIGNSSLLTIYDYDKLNDLAKIIVLNSSLFISGIGDENKNLWDEKYCDKSQFKDVKDKIIATRYLVKMCSLEQNRSEAYKFVFWALMVLSVDKTEVEERLSLICDFAQMLNITVDEIEDIVHVIERIYDESDNQYNFKTTKIPQIFGGLWKNGRNKENKRVVREENSSSSSTIPVDIPIPSFLRKK